MTLHFQLAKYNKSKVLNFKLCPVADSKKKKHNNTHTDRTGLRLLIYDRRCPRRYLQTLNQKPSSTCDS